MSLRPAIHLGPHKINSRTYSASLLVQPIPVDAVATFCHYSVMQSYHFLPFDIVHRQFHVARGSGDKADCGFWIVGIGIIAK